MNQLISTIRRGGRAALVALALGAASLGALATPAVAQSPSFNFQFQVPGGSVEFGTQGRRSDMDRDRDFRWERDRDRYCLSDRRITRELREEGWRNIEFGRELRRNRVEIVAQYGRSYYKLIADRCDGDIRVVERIRNRGRSGFGLQFNFGN